MGLSLEMNAIDMMMNAYSQQELFGCSVNAEHHNQQDSTSGLFAHICTHLIQVYLHTLSAPGVWLFTLVSLVAALLPDVVIRQILLNFPKRQI